MTRASSPICNLFARALIEIANDPCERFCGGSGGGVACGCGRGTLGGVVDGGTVGNVCGIAGFGAWEFGFTVEATGADDVCGVGVVRGLDCTTGAGGVVVTCVGAGG